jgi:4-oxalocrotonate tautomerase family enzyme
MPLINISMFEGRTDAQKKAVAAGIMKVFEEELGSGPAHTWIVFQDVAKNDWYTGSESQVEIDARRQKG